MRSTAIYIELHLSSMSNGRVGTMGSIGSFCELPALHISFFVWCSIFIVVAANLRAEKPFRLSPQLSAPLVKGRKEGSNLLVASYLTNKPTINIVKIVCCCKTIIMRVVALALLVAVAAALDATTTSNEAMRALQQNYNNYNYNNAAAQQQQQQQQQYYNANGDQNQNYEQFLRAEVAKRTFSFTGCSTTTTSYGWQIAYATFRICDSCHNNGCNNDNGDYIVSMREFGEAYGEYWEQVTWQKRETAPLRCVKAQESPPAYYQQQMYNQANNAQQQQQYYYQQRQYYQNGNGGGEQQQQEYFVGPVCDGSRNIKVSYCFVKECVSCSSSQTKTIAFVTYSSCTFPLIPLFPQVGLFWDENCAMPVEKWSLEAVLGFNPNKDGNHKIDLPKCVPCASTTYQYNGNGEVELNPLCDRMLDDSGRCDRDTHHQSQFDISWINGKGGQQNQNQENNGRNNYYYGVNTGCPSDLTVYQCQNKKTCALVDSLTHIQRERRVSTTGIAVIVVAGLSICAALCYYGRGGRLGLRGVPPSPKMSLSMKEPIASADYQQEMDNDKDDDDEKKAMA